MKSEEDKDIQVQEGEEVAGKTIVGGRPLRRRDMKMSIPAGIEKTLYKAAIDPEFKIRLFEDRFETIGNNGFVLTDLERTMLASIPDARLETIIDQIRPETHGKRKFMKAVATAVVTLAASTSAMAIEGCNLPVGGSVADPPDVTADAVDASTTVDAAVNASSTADAVDTGILIEKEHHATRGVAPDKPGDWDKIDEIVIEKEPPAPGGAVPDIPGEMEVYTEEMSTGGIAPDEIEVDVPPPSPKGGAIPDMPEEGSGLFEDED